jgi:hypothetical protein
MLAALAMTPTSEPSAPSEERTPEEDALLRHLRWRVGIAVAAATIGIVVLLSRLPTASDVATPAFILACLASVTASTAFVRWHKREDWDRLYEPRRPHGLRGHLYGPERSSERMAEAIERFGGSLRLDSVNLIHYAALGSTVLFTLVVIAFEA